MAQKNIKVKKTHKPNYQMKELKHQKYLGALNLIFFYTYLFILHVYVCGYMHATARMSKHYSCHIHDL